MAGNSLIDESEISPMESRWCFGSETEPRETAECIASGKRSDTRCLSGEDGDAEFPIIEEGGVRSSYPSEDDIDA